MAVSVNSVLFYGYIWNEPTTIIKCQNGNEKIFDWDEIYLKNHGHKDPWDTFPEEEIKQIQDSHKRKEVMKEWELKHREELNDWNKNRMIAYASFKVDIGYHSSIEELIPYLYVFDSKFLAYEKRPVQINMQEISSAELSDWDTQLDKFINEFNIKKPHEKPGWFLVSYWG